MFLETRRRWPRPSFDQLMQEQIIDKANRIEERYDSDSALSEAAEELQGKTIIWPIKTWITKKTLDLVEHQHWLERLKNWDACFEARNESATAAPNIWENCLANTIDVDLDIRDKWLGSWILTLFSKQL